MVKRSTRLERVGGRRGPGDKVRGSVSLLFCATMFRHWWIGVGLRLDSGWVGVGGVVLWMML